jgi:tRNA A-37 threonylcarbamoyl transferase component Bud32
MYEFCETFETLNHFRKEIDAYIRVADLYGLLVPRVFGYGASWGYFLGFITMEAIG